MKKLPLLFLLFTIHYSLFTASAATVPMPTAKTSVISTTTNVRQKVTPTGLFDQTCYDTYFSCMDQFCIVDNANGGACGCSDDNAGYQAALANIDKQNQNATQLSTVEVEKIQAGANADIIFGNDRQYDAQGNVITQQKKDAATAAQNSQAAALALFNAPIDTSDAVFSNADDISTLTGSALYAAAADLCRTRLPDTCARDVALLTPLYTTQIKNDCAAFANAVKKLQATADQTLASAQKDVRDALSASFQAANKYDRGTCLINFKTCMLWPDVCGADWSRCAQYVAAENAQIATKSTAGTKIVSTDKYNISASTSEMLNSKRNMCESVLDQCVAVRDLVWPDFIRDIAPELHLAELNLESNYRQNCMDTISQCAIKSCNTDFGGQEKSQPMEACLARPEILRAACKVQIDPCERMEPQIWSYVLDKLAALSVDACTQEVKDCFTDSGRCGSDFSQCIGMDFNAMHQMCPVDLLVVCKHGKSDFSLSDIDGMLMGFFLNVDNSELQNCQNLVTAKMTEICGSTTDCNKFAADDTLGSNSVHSQKIGDLYRVTGMITFGRIMVGNGMPGAASVKDAGKQLAAGEIGVADYIDQVRSANKAVPDADAIIGNIEAELNNIAGTINRTIDLIGSDPKIQFCVSGRDMSQITGKDEKTTARFPNLLNQVKMVIASAALRQANDNYNRVVNAAIAQATKDASADVAQYMCQKMAQSGGAMPGGTSTAPSTPLQPPFAISYDIGVGLTLQQLTQDGHGTNNVLGGATATDVTAPGASYHFSATMGNVTRESWAAFNRDTRTCHLCVSTTTQNCETKGSLGLWGLWDSRGQKCTTSEPVQDCQDIPM